MQFEWDVIKARKNRRKHRISFDEAVTVFRDPLADLFYDERHSDLEVREIIIGYSVTGRLLVVSFTERAENIVRIISARRATPQERRNHEENQGR